MSDLSNKGFDGIIEWLKINHKGPLPEWKIKYVTELYYDPQTKKVKGKYINDYLVGRTITNSLTKESWTIDKPAGITSYDPSFKPNYSPDVIIRMGIFGGLCIQDIDSELPIEWVLYALIDDKIRPYNKFSERDINFYGTIAEPLSKKNFFHWYIRYYLGKRSKEDSIKITLWESYTSQLKELIVSNSSYSYLTVRQILLQWGCKS